jgi:hypothetical protein
MPSLARRTAEADICLDAADAVYGRVTAGSVMMNGWHLT